MLSRSGLGWSNAGDPFHPVTNCHSRPYSGCISVAFLALIPHPFLMLLLRLRCCRPPVLALLAAFAATSAVQAQEFEELTPASELALDRGLEWLAKNQGKQGNWESNDLGLVAMVRSPSCPLATRRAGVRWRRGPAGPRLHREYARPSGLLNISDAQRDMYNHGLATFVLGQSQGMTLGSDRRMNNVLDNALKLISGCQCEDGGWDYKRIASGMAMT